MLRLAESLDRSHAQTVTAIELHDRGDDGLLQVRTSGDAELELWPRRDMPRRSSG